MLFNVFMAYLAGSFFAAFLWGVQLLDLNDAGQS